MRQIEVSLFDHPGRDHHLLYNGLADVMDADRDLTANGRGAVLDDLIDVIRAHALQNVAGVRLLHKHCDIAADEIMVEQEAEENDAPVLATRPEPFRRLGRRVAPNSYRFLAEQIQPVEYSDDPVVHDAAADLLARRDFLNEFAAALDRRGMSDTLGLMVAPRSFYDRPAPAGRPLLVESSYEVSRANVVRYHATHEFDPDKLLQTVWMASDSLLAASCPTLCSMKCTPTGLCVEDDYGKHGPVLGHDKSHPKPHWNAP